MPKSIKEVLPDLSDEDILEVLEGNVVFEELESEHRWYQVWNKVAKIDDRFFQFPQYHCTGDDSVSDMGLTVDVDDVEEVEEYEKVIKAYRKVQ